MGSESQTQQPTQPPATAPAGHPGTLSYLSPEMQRPDGSKPADGIFRGVISCLVFVGCLAVCFPIAFNMYIEWRVLLREPGRAVLLLACLLAMIGCCTVSLLSAFQFFLGRKSIRHVIRRWRE